MEGEPGEKWSASEDEVREREDPEIRMRSEGRRLRVGGEEGLEQKG